MLKLVKEPTKVDIKIPFINWTELSGTLQGYILSLGKKEFPKHFLDAVKVMNEIKKTSHPRDGYAEVEFEWTPKDVYTILDLHQHVAQSMFTALEMGYGDIPYHQDQEDRESLHRMAETIQDIKTQSEKQGMIF